MSSNGLSLVVDVMHHWWQQTIRQPGIVVSLMLLAIPIALITQLAVIKTSYTEPTYSGMTTSDQIAQIVQSQSEGESNGAVLPHIANEIQRRWELPVIFERQSWLTATIAGDDNIATETEIRADFFSGGYRQLGIKPALGSLEPLEFPDATTQIRIAITYDYWQNAFGGADIIDRSVVVNETLLVIAAVMPPSYESFRRGNAVDLVIPYAHMPALLNTALDENSPDTLSYVLADSNQRRALATNIEAELREAALMFDDEQLLFSEAFGLTLAQYNKVLSRLNTLSQLFWGLLLFSIFAFVSYLLSDNERRQNEIALRVLLGANKQQILVQQLVELTALFVTLSVFICVCLVVFVPLIRKMIPDIEVVEGAALSAYIMAFMTISVLATVVILLMFWLQQKLFASSLGRGSSLSRGQKLQMFALLSLLVSMSSFSIVKTTELLILQWQYLQVERGFKSDQRLIASFDFPKLGGGTFYYNNQPQLLIAALQDQELIDQAAITSSPMLLDKTNYTRLYTANMAPLSGLNNPQVLTASVSPNYFDVTGTTLIQGKTLSWDNYWQAVISNSLWNKHFSDQSLADAKLAQVFDDGRKALIDIVGVAQDVHFSDPDKDPELTVYRIAATVTGLESLILRSGSSPQALKPVVDAAVSEITPLLTNSEVVSLASLIEKQEAPQQALLIISSLISLLLVCSTIVFCYSSVKVLLAKCAREISLRLTLGSSTWRLLWNESANLVISALPFLVASLLMLATFAGGEQSSLIPKEWVLHQSVVLFITTFFALLIFVVVFLRKGLVTLKKNCWQFLT